MNYIDYVSMPWHKKAVYKVKQFLKNLPHNCGNICKIAGKKISSGIFFAGKEIKTYFTVFIKGDIRTKLSYFIMGSGCILRGQIVKGFAFLALQSFYIVYMISFGWGWIKLLPTLGIAVKKEYWDEENQIFRYIQGDNSMLILLFSVLTIVITFAMLTVYIMNIKVSYHNQLDAAQGKKIPHIHTDIKTLFSKKLHFVFLSLPVLGIIMFTILPLIFMVLIAFTNYDKSHQPPGSLFTWVGFDNFRNILGGDKVLASSLSGIFGWTVIWAIFATFTNYILGILLALLINKKGIKLKKMWRTFFVVTIAIPQFVTLLLMAQLLANSGPINIILGYLGLPAVPFLTDVTMARIMVIVVNIWVGVPYTVLITTGILMNIPKDMYESARIDGAGPIKTFTKITLPYMLFVTTPYLITQFVGNMNNFNVIYLLTGGGPLSLDYYQAGKTDLLVTWLYKLTVNQQDYNLASTIGIIIFAIQAVLSLVIYNSTGSVRKEGKFQ